MFDFKTASKIELKNEYKKIATEMGDDQFFTKKELNYLPEILMKNEQVLGFTSGLMKGNTWLITLTDKRIIFLDKGMIYGLKQSIVDLDKVNAVSGSTGLFFGTIIITDGANDRLIKNVWKKTVKNFTNKIQEAIEARKLTQHAVQQTQQKDVDPYEQLEKIAKLKDKGIISEEEFKTQKKKILEAI